MTRRFVSRSTALIAGSLVVSVLAAACIIVALTLSGLGVFTLLLFWTGLPAVLATGGFVLGRTQLDIPEDRRVALAAMRLGAAAIALYVLLSVADLLL